MRGLSAFLSVATCPIPSAASTGRKKRPARKLTLWLTVLLSAVACSLPTAIAQGAPVNGTLPRPLAARARSQHRNRIGSAPVTPGVPFIATPNVPAYTGMRSLANNQIIFVAWNAGNASTDDGDRVEQFGVSGASVDFRQPDRSRGRQPEQLQRPELLDQRDRCRHREGRIFRSRRQQFTNIRLNHPGGQPQRHRRPHQGLYHPAPGCRRPQQRRHTSPYSGGWRSTRRPTRSTMRRPPRMPRPATRLSPIPASTRRPLMPTAASPIPRC